MKGCSLHECNLTLKNVQSLLEAAEPMGLAPSMFQKLAPRRKSTTSPMTSCCLPVSQPPRRALQSACAPGGKKRCRRRRVVVGGRGRGGRGRSCLRSRLWSWCGRSWSWSWWLSWLSCREMAVLSCDPARFRGRAVLGLLDGVHCLPCLRLFLWPFALLSALLCDAQALLLHSAHAPRR